jgi:hypothetical protein
MALVQRAAVDDARGLACLDGARPGTPEAELDFKAKEALHDVRRAEII